MGQELTQVVCPECGTSGESADPAASRWQCSKCGNGFYLRRCAACARVGYVDGLQGWHHPWPCMWCGESNAGFSQNQDRAAATVAELAAELARYGPAADSAGPAPAGQATPAPDADVSRDPGTQVLAAPQPPRVPRSGRWGARRIALWATVVVACVTASSLLLAAKGTGTTSRAAGLAVRENAARAVQVIAGHVRAIELDGVPGQLSVTGAGTGPVRLTGELHWTGGAPVVVARRGPGGGVLTVAIRCAPASPCTQDLRLVVPAGTGTTLRQRGGRVVLAGLAGPLRITAANADIRASGLRSSDLVATITAGHLGAVFIAPPRQVCVTLSSAQATVRLPRGVAYRVSRRVWSGHVNVAIPESGSASRTVTARLRSGELELLS